MATRKRGFGQIRKLPSKRWQAFYTGPDTALHYAPSTFDAAEDAEGWLSRERALISSEQWTPPKVRKAQRHAPKLTLESYSATWLAERDIKPRTRDHYRDLLDRVVLPDLGTLPVKDIDAATVRSWYASLPSAQKTQRAHGYSLLRAIMRTLEGDGVIDKNPCTIPGAGASRRSRKVTLVSLDELATIVDAMPPRLRLMPLLAAWCGGRYGELTELRRRDIDLDAGVIGIHRGVVWVKGKPIVGTPKSDAGIRDINFPPHLRPAIKEHMSSHVGPRRDDLLFPASSDPNAHMHPTSFQKPWWRARAAAGRGPSKKGARDGLRFHDLRHLGATLAAGTGASLRELMSRLGHSTTHAAMIYQHTARGRDAEIADALSELATGNVVSIETAKKRSEQSRETS